MVRGSQTPDEVRCDGFKLDSAKVLQRTHALEPRAPRRDNLFRGRFLTSELLVLTSKLSLDDEPSLLGVATKFASHLEVVSTSVECSACVGVEQLPGARSRRLVLEQVVYLRQKDPPAGG